MVFQSAIFIRKWPLPRDQHGTNGWRERKKITFWNIGVLNFYFDWSVVSEYYLSISDFNTCKNCHQENCISTFKHRTTLLKARLIEPKRYKECSCPLISSSSTMISRLLVQIFPYPCCMVSNSPPQYQHWYQFPAPGTLFSQFPGVCPGVCWCL